MFSDYLRKFDEMPYKTLLLVAAGLIILCQLMALAIVADEQVAKAKVRESQRNAEMLAIAQCRETSAGAARRSCIQQVRTVAGPSQPPVAGGAQNPQALAEVSSMQAGVTPAHPPQGFMAASFALR